MQVQVTAIKTRKLLPPRDDLFALLDSCFEKLEENVIVIVASKVVSIGEGRCVKQDRVQSKDELIRQEADKYLPREAAPGGWVMHTIKNNLLMPSAGVDGSNSGDYYILWPKNPFQSARDIWSYLRTKHKVKNLGVIIADSHTVPMRRGITGISIGHWGFKPLRDYRGKTDLFGRKFRMSQANIPDSLGAAGVFVMGEGSEQTPIALITGVAGIKFVSGYKESAKPYSSFSVPMEEDLYRPFLKGVPWEEGGRKLQKQKQKNT